MGNYLNTTSVCDAYSREFHSPYFVDKSLILDFFSSANDAGAVFDKLKIAESQLYKTYAGKYDVVFISFNELPRRCRSYEQYIERIEDRL